MLDGAYTFAGDRPRFHRARPPTDDELERLRDTLIRRIVRMLTRSGTLVVGPEEQAALGQLAEHVVSLRTNPPIKPGTKDPYEPPK